MSQILARCDLCEEMTPVKDMAIWRPRNCRACLALVEKVAEMSR